jgi:hypothetical protein
MYHVDGKCWYMNGTVLPAVLPSWGISTDADMCTPEVSCPKGKIVPPGLLDHTLSSLWVRSTHI